MKINKKQIKFQMRKSLITKMNRSKVIMNRRITITVKINKMITVTITSMNLRKRTKMTYRFKKLEMTIMIIKKIMKTKEFQTRKMFMRMNM